MIRFGLRQSFNTIEQIEERYANINFPVEVALPYYWDIYEPVRPHLGEIAEKIKSYGTEVLSVHAVQAPISDDRFKAWGRETAEFTKTIGSTIITLHPNNVNKDDAVQNNTLKNLEFLTGLLNNEITFCIETF